MKTIEVNGQAYELIEREERKSKNNSSLAAAMLMATMAQVNAYGTNNYERKLPEGIDIVKEFALIQQKKSKLSKWNRDKVVSIFNSYYKKIEQ